MNQTFVLFGKAHVAGLLLIVLSLPLFGILFKRYSSKVRFFSLFFIVVIWVMELYLPFFTYFDLHLNWQQSLPLHMCDFSRLFLSFFLLLEEMILFEVGFFWGIGGALIALVFPDLRYSFPSVEYICFFITHAIILIVITYVLVVHPYYRPTLKSCLRAAAVGFVMMWCIFFINRLLGQSANYWYLSDLPNSVMALKAIAPSPPWHIFIIVLLALTMFACIYGAYKITGFFKKRSLLWLRSD